MGYFRCYKFDMLDLKFFIFVLKGYRCEEVPTKNSKQKNN